MEDEPQYHIRDAVCHKQSTPRAEFFYLLSKKAVPSPETQKKYKVRALGGGDLVMVDLVNELMDLQAKFNSTQWGLLMSNEH